jgi:hypothetical protein
MPCTRTEGIAGVPLRFPRPSMAPVAVALIAGWIALNSAPALADQVRQSEWWLPKLHITAAQRISDGSGVTVAVLSTGVDAAAPDLAGSVLTGPDFTDSGRTAGGPFFGISGTEIASLIAGHGHGPGNSEGILGVAPAAKILSVRVTLDSGDPLLANPAMTARLPVSIADGIRYATKNGASVIDLPLDPGAAGASGAPGVPGLAVSSPAEQSAVAYALRKGVVLVAPAGDDGAGTGIVNYPAAYPGVISVGAFDQNLAKAPFSSRKSYVTLTAAGEGVTAEAPAGYATISSTSAASATVTGIVAIIKSEFPALTPRQVTKALTSGTQFRRPGGRLTGSGFGTADAARALRAATVMAEPRGQRAGAGAVARAAPVTPAVPATRPPLAPKLRRDGVISLAVLLVLLLPITVYALVRRHRRRREESESDFDSGWPDEPVTTQFATAGIGAAEQAEFLPSPPAGLGTSRGHAPGPDSPATPAGVGAVPGAAAFAGAANFTGARAFTGSSAGGMAAAGRHPDPGGRADAAPPAGTAQRPGAVPDAGPSPGPGAGERLALAPMMRAVHGRAKVSGSPPWEPAPKPDSELPWATAPAPPPATSFIAPPHRNVQPARSLWDVAASGGRTEPPGPVPQPAPEPEVMDVWQVSRPSKAGPGTEPPGPAPQPQVMDVWQVNRASKAGPEPASSPTYGWNPVETTETFPAVREDDGA